MINGEPTETAYQISWDWYQARDRSLDEVLAARLCGGHPAGQAAGPERRRAITDPESGELRFVAEPDTDPIAIIASHCATQSDFITSTMPLMEAVFRVFLAKENAPLTAEEIHDELRAWFAASPRSRYFTVETIARLLEHDRYYGITPVLAGARRAE